MADTLSLQDITVECRLGVHEWERETPQTAWVDLELAIDAAAAAAADDVEATVDYAALVESVRRLAQSRPYRLLETLAEEIASLVLGEAGTPWVRVRVKKQALPGVGYAAVEIERAAARRRAARRPARGRRRTAASGR
ncbi:MAG: dihydroneopterin aldolase [Candidatus Omnitrophica bacterium]|nr:dihydroneopterin aldolase [Candidatus Omnitrophota bacterium]